ncbi:unnamed protein product [Protopolystoma xenopodis]|uniref:Uncharacterized protein n=1 Tax=Protopolystoma xenopodis TaxID=117903 RepID=A0A448WGQ8_9PLAT|nr:unnamed protein product [Protopolystoma xenopodis]
MTPQGQVLTSAPSPSSCTGPGTPGGQKRKTSAGLAMSPAVAAPSLVYGHPGLASQLTAGPAGMGLCSASGIPVSSATVSSAGPCAGLAVANQTTVPLVQTASGVSEDASAAAAAAAAAAVAAAAAAAGLSLTGLSTLQGGQAHVGSNGASAAGGMLAANAGSLQTGHPGGLGLGPGGLGGIGQVLAAVPGQADEKLNYTAL